MLRGFLLIFVLAGIVIVAMCGFRGEHSNRTPWEIFPDMVRQQKVRAQSPIDFFADGRGPRVPIANTVPIGYEMPKPQLKAPPGITPSGAAPGEELWRTRIGFSAGTDYYNTGKMGTNWGTGIPVPVSAELMRRGQQRFNITCSVCHGLTATGNGIAKQYGLNTVATLQDERIRKMADGEIFNTITNGKNTMMSYGGNVPVADRWAIIAYVRALQRSQNAAANDVPPAELAKLEKAEAKPQETKPAPSPEAQKK
jgi:mono/diheme cytochrome c family protein